MALITTLVLMLGLASVGAAQQESLADLARRVQAEKNQKAKEKSDTKAKRIVTNDDIRHLRRRNYKRH